MSKVSQVLAKKGNQVWSIDPKRSVYQALQIMAEKNVGALLVMQSGKVVGIFSERDYARKVVLKDKSSRETNVDEIMTENVILITGDDSIEDCMTTMSERHIRHLPVVEDGKLVGIISIGDLVNFIISEQEFKIDQLESYIQGNKG